MTEQPGTLEQIDPLRHRILQVTVVCLTMLVVISITFNVLGWLSIRKQASDLITRANDNRRTLHIVEDATSPQAQEARWHVVHCLVNHIDVDAGRGVLDPTCQGL